MSKEKITVSFINPPKEGKKLWTIKTRDDKIFGVRPEKKDLFSKGGTYEIEYSSSEYNGKTYHRVESVKEIAPSPSSNGSGAATNGHSNGSGSTSDQIRWQTFTKVGGEIVAAMINSGVSIGGGVPLTEAAATAAILAIARPLFAAKPYDVIEDAKEVLNAAPALPSEDEGPNW